MATSPTTPVPIPGRNLLLDLGHYAEVNEIRIDGVGYELRQPDQLTLVEGARLKKIGPRHDELLRKEAAGTLDETEAAELAVLLDTMTRVVLVAPETVHAALKDWQRIAIVLTFIGLSTPRLQATGATTEAAPSSSSPTGESSSPSSRATTRRSRRKRG